MATTGSRHAGSTGQDLLRTAAKVAGATFLLVGLLGFIPGITTNYGDMQFAGHDSNAQLLGLFKVSVLHNLVHLAFGIAGLAMARSASGAKAFLLGSGLIYLLLWLYGLLVDERSNANFVPFDTADNWLHFLLGAGLLGLGALLGRQQSTSRAA